MPLGVKLEFSIDVFCRSLIGKGFMHVFVTGNVCLAGGVTLPQLFLFCYEVL